MSDMIRCFIAVKISDDLHRALQTIQKQFAALELDIKWVKPENIHLTLRFLGDQPPKKVKKMIRHLPEWFRETRGFEIRLGGLGAFPNLKRPRVLWLGVEKNADLLIRMAETLGDGLSRIGIRKEARPFAPHLTLGRIRSGKNTSRLANVMETFAPETPLIQTVEQVTLLQSTLSPEGAEYSILDDVRLT